MANRQKIDDIIYLWWYNKIIPVLLAYFAKKAQAFSKRRRLGEYTLFAAVFSINSPYRAKIILNKECFKCESKADIWLFCLPD